MGTVSCALAHTVKANCIIDWLLMAGGYLKQVPPQYSDPLTLLHSEWPKLYGVLAVLSAIGLRQV